MHQIDLNKSLQQLDGKDWGDATFDSHLVTECHRLHRLPLCNFKVEDLRIMIGQNIGLEYLLPLALEHLRENPFAEGSHYPCDLLVNVLGADSQYWRHHTEWREEIVRIAERAIALFSTVPDTASKTVTRAVIKAYGEFKKGQSTISIIR